jgi:regulator of protease activity HflC (stomatin/prohibitin superfamily)
MTIGDIMAGKTLPDETNDSDSKNIVIETSDIFPPSSTNRWGTVFLRWIIALVLFLAFIAAAWYFQSVLLLIVGVLVSAILFSCSHVILEWERVIVLRFGKFSRVAGPGMVFMIPFVEYAAATVDLRMRSTAFKAEHVLTADLVPVDVDAVLFWLIWDAKKACSEIRNYEQLVFWVAQTTLRDVMGGIGIAQMGLRRTQIDQEIATILERKTNEWGITIVSVEIRDIEIPGDLQEALSAEARAEREYNARVILAEVEKEISGMYVEAARIYKEEDAALQLRAMSFVSDSVKEKGGLVILPSAIADAFEGLKKIVN